LSVILGLTSASEDILMDEQGHSGLVDNDYCFACGRQNPFGLQLEFTRGDSGEGVQARFNPGPHLQGFAGLLHGGISATVLDDVMNNLVTRTRGILAVTGSLEVRYRKPVPITATLICRAQIVKERGGMFYAEAELVAEETGEVLVEAKSLQVAVKR
jgi:acyl-coenzyme A thioesterase PaaI-like protein